MASSTNGSVGSAVNGLSMTVFAIITCLYIILKQKFGYKYFAPNSNDQRKEKKKTRHILLGIYVLAAFFSQYYFNAQATKSICGTTQTTTAFIMTLIPNILMFGLLIILFAFFPGWKAPFSNTFGYAAAFLSGVKKVFIEMIDTRKGGTTLSQDIYDNPSLMINYITPNNFDTFMSKMQNNKEIGPTADQYFDKLYKLVTLKDSIAELIWYLLVGSLVISVSYNALTDLPCRKNTDAMMAAHIDWARDQNTATPPPEPKIYYTRE